MKFTHRPRLRQIGLLIAAVTLLSAVPVAVAAEEEKPDIGPPNSAEETKALEDLSSHGVLASPIAAGYNWHIVNFRGVTQPDASLFTDIKAAPSIVELDLAGAKFTPEELQNISGLSHLKKLNLAMSNVTDEALSSIAKLEKLEWLNLFSTGVTDAGLAQLAGVKTLHKLYLFQTKVTDAGVDALKKALPGIIVDRGWDLNAPAPPAAAATPATPATPPPPAAEKKPETPAAPATPKPAEKKTDAPAPKPEEKKAETPPAPKPEEKKAPSTPPAPAAPAPANTPGQPAQPPAPANPAQVQLVLVSPPPAQASTNTLLQLSEGELILSAVECTPRGGMPNVIAKLSAGKPVRVGYLGGSITAAPGWRVKSLKWLQEKYPAASLSEINAAIGGTGSDLGVFRVQRDVLQFKPDLLFVEFAVNDGGAIPAQIQRCMEGIVRQTWRADPATDICFVYTVSQPYLDELKAGNLSRAATAMEGVADHYAIPSIHLGMEAARMEKEGKLIFKGEKPKAPVAEGAPMVFSEDGVHPFAETGHELYLQAIQRSFPKIEAACLAEHPHALGAPLRADNWENAKLVPITKEMLHGDWAPLDLAKDDLGKRFSSRLPALWKAAAPGASLEFDVDGTEASAYDLLGPDSGQLEVQVDGQPVRKLARFDAYCTGHRLGKAVFLSGAPAGKHHIRVTLSAEPPDKAKILFEKNLPDMQKNPEHYAGNYWYTGALLILGSVAQ